jgi:undecaprenyl-diphosphatase
VIFAIAFAIFLANRKVGGFLLLFACLHAFSRVYVGVHYPFDVLVGAAGGMFIAFIVIWVIKALEKWVNIIMGIARKLYLA